MKRIAKLLLSLTVISFMTIKPATYANAAEVKTTTTKDTNKVVSTYLPLYKTWKAEDISGNKLTDIYISFGMFDEELNLAFPSWLITDLNEAKRLKELYPNLRVHLSLGGGEIVGFSKMTASTELRNRYVGQVMEAVKKYNLDGVDVDWEFPVGPDYIPEDQRHPEDRENYTLFMSELRAGLDKLGNELNRKMYLSYAAHPSYWAISNIEASKIWAMVDRINIMNYLYDGAWSSKTGHASNLYNYKESTWGLNTDSVINAYIASGAPAEKIVLGAPNYAQEYCNVKNENNGLGQPFNGTKNLWLTYDQLKSEYINKNGFVRYWDDSAKVPYLFNGDMFISYEDPQSAKCKADYIKANNLGGSMTWEYLQDTGNEILDVYYNELGINEWKSNTKYVAGDKVKFSGIIYECVIGHSSMSNWSPILAPSLWKGLKPVNGSWYSSISYEKGDLISYNGAKYKCNIGHTSQKGWEPDSLSGLWQKL